MLELSQLVCPSEDLGGSRKSVQVWAPKQDQSRTRPIVVDDDPGRRQLPRAPFGGPGRGGCPTWRLLAHVYFRIDCDPEVSVQRKSSRAEPRKGDCELRGGHPRSACFWPKRGTSHTYREVWIVSTNPVKLLALRFTTLKSRASRLATNSDSPAPSTWPRTAEQSLAARRRDRPC